jgi:hypothetical protein
VRGRSSRGAVGRYPTVHLRHLRNITRVGSGWVMAYEMHPLHVARPPSGSADRELACPSPTCTLTVPCTILSIAQTRKRRRIRGTLALAGVFTTVSLAWLAIVQFNPEGSARYFLGFGFGLIGALVATAFLIDAWWIEDGVWLRDPSSGVRIPRLGPRSVRGPHSLGYPRSRS